MHIYKVFITDRRDELKVIIEQPRVYLDRKFIMRAFEHATLDMEIGETDSRIITVYRDDSPILYGHVSAFPSWQNSSMLWVMRRYADHKAAYWRYFENEED